MQPSQVSGALVGRKRHDLGDGLTKAGYANRLPRLSDLFEDAEALGFELGDGDFLDLSSYTMVNDHGQSIDPKLQRRFKAPLNTPSAW